MSALADLGWDDYFAEQFARLQRPDLAPARVIAEDRRVYLLAAERGELPAEVTGRLLHTKRTVAELPKVGDWVACMALEGEERAIIHAVLERRTSFSRRDPGPLPEEQVLAANVDVLFIVQSLDSNFNPRRLERYLAMAREGGVQPVVVLNKADLAGDLDEQMAAAQASAGDTPIIAISATGEDLSALRQFLAPRRTFALVGSSGVGKSTIVNKLAGHEIQDTFEVNVKGDRGRHTTTRRQLFTLPDGALLIDSPGMRSLGMWLGEDGLSETFNDIEELATQCHFSNCTHTSELRCAVRAAVDQGRLAQARYDNYVRLHLEMTRLEGRQAKGFYQAKRAREKAIAQWARRTIVGGRKRDDVP